MALSVSVSIGTARETAEPVRAPLSEMILVAQRPVSEAGGALEVIAVAVAYAASAGWSNVEAAPLDGASEHPQDRFVDFIIRGEMPSAPSAYVMTPQAVMIPVDAAMKHSFVGIRIHAEQGCIELNWTEKISTEIIPPDECTTRMNT